MQNDVSQPGGIAGRVEAAADALAAAIHAVYNDAGSEEVLVAELYLAVGDVALIVERLPQLLRHMQRRLVEVHERSASNDVVIGAGSDLVGAAAAALGAAAVDISQTSTGRGSPIATARERLGAIGAVGE